MTPDQEQKIAEAAEFHISQLGNPIGIVASQVVAFKAGAALGLQMESDQHAIYKERARQLAEENTRLKAKLAEVDK